MTKLEAARKEVAKHEFGTYAWEAAMEIVRELVEEENAKIDLTDWNCDSDGQWWN